MQLLIVWWLLLYVDSINPQQNCWRVLKDTQILNETHRQLISDIFGPNFFISDHTWNLLRLALQLL